MFTSLTTRMYSRVVNTSSWNLGVRLSSHSHRTNWGGFSSLNKQDDGWIATTLGFFTVLFLKPLAHSYWYSPDFCSLQML